jgi:predicted CopG family antitoxin
MRSQLELVPEKDKKLIKIEPHVHRQLNEVGLRGESFSQIIERLVKFYKEHQGE